ncbi:Phage-related minor tail protein [Streptomyces sp. YIM 121038]|uniref:phage tail tape measure protein n=1 Tax=Streptomyces sp. YIM 121038 TaxID=2136401 RepID=UPI0011101C16|nr:phage tail tape measure protein [Streptomyces sp. YIM 121038]QCX81044.1 Phage-related minor tail protein [Streptomyces sp. YIM 121038]
MPSVGYATLQVIPSVRGIGDELRRQLIGPAGDAGQDAGEAAGSGLRDKVKMGAAAAGAAAGALFVAGIQEAMDQANITSTLKAQLGATGKDAARYGKIAGQLYAKGITEDVAQGAEIIRSVINAGLVPPDATNKQLKAISAQMADVANTFGTDMSLQTQAVSAMLKNKLAPNAAAALDVITVGMQKLGPNAEDLLETFQEYSVQLRKLGIDSSEALGLFRQGIQGGARDTDIIADAFKEFSIRAVDMSDGSREAYKALGLDAKDMEKQIGQGGDAAQRGLQTVLDKLRSMKDPVKREAAAVGLFGTQAEDLGKALFKLDPGKAVSVMGDVAGSAKKLGKDLHSGPSYEIEVFTRGLKQSFVNVLGGQVLPVIAKAGAFMNRAVLPPLKATGSVVVALLVPALTALWTAGTGTVAWLRDMGVWLIPVGILVAGLTVAITAQAIATGAVTATFALYRAAILAWTVVQRGATIAQAAFNAVMNANPVVLVITAIVALGAALVIAYQRSATFRSVVQAVWAGVQTGALAVWGVLKMLFAGFLTGLRAIGAAAVWLWSTVLKPVFGFIDTALRILLTVVTIVVFGPIYLAIRLLGATFMWLWAVAIGPTVRLIVAGWKLMWAGIQVVLGLLIAGVRGGGAAVRWLYDAAVAPVVRLVVAGFRLMWTGVKVVFGLFTAGLKGVGAGAKWLWTNAISPAMSGIKSVISTVYNTGIKPVLAALRGAVGKTADSFETARRAIKIAWDKVKGIAKGPVSFIIDTVYNGGIVRVWNAVASKFGAPTLHKIAGLARGGVLPGTSSWRQGDDQLVPMRRGEGVYVSEAMRDPYERARLHAVNRAAMSGRSLQPYQGGGFAKGGIFDWVKDAASKGGDLVTSGVSWLKDGVKASAMAGFNKIVQPLIDKISGSASLYKDMVTKIPQKILKTVLSYSGEADKKFIALGVGGKGYKGALAWARTQAGKPYQWAGNGNPSWDCSGFMSAIESVIRGQKPHRRWATGAFSGSSAPAGWVRGKRSPFMIGITNAGVGHTAGTLNGVNVESRGGDGVLVGKRARGAGDFLFTARYGFNAKGYASGGRPRPGELAWVGEMGPELVRFGSGTSEVYDHRTSVQMAAGLGARGFAKGTSKAKAAARARATARGQIPGDLTGASKALTGSVAEIKRAFDELTKDLRAAGGAGRALAASSSKASAKLQALAKQRDSVDKRLQEAKAAAADQKKSAADFFGLGQVGEVTTFSDLLGGLQSRQDQARAFQKQIAGLSKKGVSKSIISQLVAQGPGGPLIDLVSGASKGQLAQLNQLAKSGGKLSTSYGNTMADAMFDAGSQAGKGFLTGLKAQEKELQKAMDRLGAGLVNAIKRRLKIKSPSRVTAYLGEMTGAGVGVGLDSTASAVAASAARLADAAVPEIPAVSPAGIARAASTPTGLAAGTRLRLVVEDGREFAAYVDDRADSRVSAGFARARRAQHAGSK